MKIIIYHKYYKDIFLWFLNKIINKSNNNLCFKSELQIVIANNINNRKNVKKQLINSKNLFSLIKFIKKE